MSAKVCLRCDWSGSTASDVCPNCGAPLHGAASKPRRSRSMEVTDAEEARFEGSWRGRATVAAIVVVVLAAVVFVQRHTAQPPAAPDRSALGYLVYAAPDDDGQVHLWTWNLSTATTAMGPPIAAVPTDLLFSYAPTSGWLSLTTPTPSGALRAAVLRTVDPTDTPITIGRGQLVGWLTSGGLVTVVHDEPAGGCRHRIRVVTSSIASDIRKVSLDLERCGSATNVGRNLTLPYLTLEHGGQPSVYAVNAGKLRPVLPGFRALSVSLNGDLLVQPTGASTVALFYPSSTAPPPQPVGPRRAPMTGVRVLGWDGDASNVYVLGTLHGVRGVYRIAVSPVAEPRTPELILPTDAADVSMSATPAGDVYVQTDGQVTGVRNGQPRPLMLPPGAPAPSGPVLWISTLPYSPPGAG
jgi:hypothetical protein